MGIVFHTQYTGKTMKIYLLVLVPLEVHQIEMYF